MEIKLWRLIGSLLILNCILDTTNAFSLRSTYNKISNNDKNENLQDETTINYDTTTPTPTSFDDKTIKILTTESAEFVNINIDEKITKVPPTTESEIVEAIHDILDNVRNNSLATTTVDNNLKFIDKNDELDLTGSTISPATTNLDVFTNSIIEPIHAEPLVSESDEKYNSGLLEASSLVRDFDEKIHKIKDTNSNIEIHELGTGSDSLENNIRNSVKEEISLDTVFESTALEALEDIPEPEVRKVLAEDLFDGLNIRNEDKIEENINMARNVYIDDKSSIMEIATTDENSTNRNGMKMLENITELPNIKLEDTIQNEVDITNDELVTKTTLKNLMENEDITTTYRTTLDPNEATTIAIEKKSEFRQSRGFESVNLENSSPENSNNIRRLKNPYKVNIDGLSHQAQKILNLEKNRSGRTFTSEEFLTNSENMVNNDSITEDDKNINNNEELVKNSNLAEINNLDNFEIVEDTTTTTMKNIDNIEMNSNSNQLNVDNSEEKLNLIGKNLVESSTIHADVEILNNDAEDITNLSETTTNTDEVNITTEKNNIEEISNIEKNLDETIKRTISIENSSNQSDEQNSNSLEQNSNSIETEIDDTHSDRKIILDKSIAETSTAQIEDDWAEINENNISDDKLVMDNQEDLQIKRKENPIIEQNINSIQKNENNENNVQHQVIEEENAQSGQQILNVEENTTIQSETENINMVQTEMDMKNDPFTTTIAPITSESTKKQNIKSKQEIAKTLNEEIVENENRAVENIESQSIAEKTISNKSYSSESSESSESILQITRTTDSSSSEESSESSSTTENNLYTTTIQDNQISKIDEIKNTISISSSSSEESSEEEDRKKHKVNKEESKMFDILSGNIKVNGKNTNEKNKNFDNISRNNLLVNVAPQGRSLYMTGQNQNQEYKNKILNSNLLPHQVLNKNFLTENNEKNKENLDGVKIFIQSNETHKIPSLIFETTTILPMKLFNNPPKMELLNNKRTFQTEKILIELENDTTALTETLIEAAELTTELSRHITSFRSIMEADTEIPNETHDTVTFPSSDIMAASNIGKALPNHGLKSDIIENNASIVILICTITIIMIIGLLAVTFYRYRGKHGTLDIQLEEQRCGKDNNDDDDDCEDDNETISSLNDIGNSSATQSLQSNDKHNNTTIQTNELSLLSKSHNESE